MSIISQLKKKVKLPVQRKGLLKHIRFLFSSSFPWKGNLICFKQFLFLSSWRSKWQSTPALLPGKSHGQRTLVGYSPWGRKDLDMIDDFTFTFSLTNNQANTKNLSFWCYPLSVLNVKLLPYLCSQQKEMATLWSKLS